MPASLGYARNVSQTNPHRPMLALTLRLGAALTLSIMLALVKLAQESGVHLAEILFWRQLPTVPILLAWFAMSGGVRQLATGRPAAHARRAIVGLIGMFFNFSAVTFLPLAEATTIAFTTTFWAVILSALILHEHVGRYRWAAVAIGFVGVLIITRPGSGAFPLIGALIGLVAAFLVAVISIQIRDLGKSEKPLVVVFYFALFSLPILGTALPFVYTAKSAYQWGLMAALALVGLLAQFLLTAALRFGAVASVMVMDYSSLIWATLLGWALFDHLPPASTWFGAPLVILAGLIIAWREHHLSGMRTRAEDEADGTAALINR